MRISVGAWNKCYEFLHIVDLIVCKINSSGVWMLRVCRGSSFEFKEKTKRKCVIYHSMNFKRRVKNQRKSLRLNIKRFFVRNLYAKSSSINSRNNKYQNTTCWLRTSIMPSQDDNFGSSISLISDENLQETPGKYTEFGPDSSSWDMVAICSWQLALISVSRLCIAECNQQVWHSWWSLDRSYATLTIVEKNVIFKKYKNRRAAWPTRNHQSAALDTMMLQKNYTHERY